MSLGAENLGMREKVTQEERNERLLAPIVRGTVHHGAAQNVIDGGADLTGRRQLVTNVLATWLAQGVYIVAGFIMPRAIDLHLGQTLLGVWDFAWSLVGYFVLVQIGIINSINRFVARYHAEDDRSGINRTISSVTCVLASMSVAILLILSALYWFVLPKYMGARFGNSLGDVQRTVALLGSEVAVQTLFAGFGGVLQGLHRWKLYTILQAGGYAISVLCMILALTLGASLPTIAMIHFCGVVATWVVIAISAHRIYPSLKIRVSLATRGEAWRLIHFGTKSFIPQIGELLVNQTVNLLIVSYLGPAALAVYSRPRNLAASLRTLVSKMAAVLIPSTGSLEARGQIEELQSLTIKSTRYAAFLTLPFTLLLVILGGPILSIWMGAGYSSDVLAGVLGLGTALILMQTPAFSILVGINRHGPPGRAHFVACLVTALLVPVALGRFKFGLLGTAICATAPLSFLYAFYMPFYTARSLKMSLPRYLRGSLKQPILSSLLFGACLLGSRLAFARNAGLAVLVGCLAGGFLLAPVYWRWALPPSLKERIKSLFRASRC